MERLPETIDAEHVDERNATRQELADLREDVANLREEFRKFAAVVRSARVVFGTANGTPPPAANPDSDKWERLRAKLGGKMAEVIEALQLTGTATRSQLKKQCGGALGTIDQAVYKLRDMGLLVKNGDGWSLKP